ncbi:TraR/DksA C4-type zinc finger protein [Pseudodesulfovibrio methanolicus]|uniref:TraR/DksA C4-type zinc finger protein n=1 Tax=Pseudodesulfovibrio methanolicus TaxID=3126690 RepID=A0ABZ2IZQ0_9BACT
MADECDMAQDMEALHRKIALQNAGCAAPYHEALHHCAECDAPISEARRRAVPGVRLCVRCQEEADAGHR